jgi:hypothetical protein
MKCENLKRIFRRGMMKAEENIYALFEKGDTVLNEDNI